MWNDHIYNAAPINLPSIRSNCVNLLYEWNVANNFSMAATSQSFPADIYLDPSHWSTVKLNFDCVYNPFSQSTTGIEGIIRSVASTLISAYAGKTGADNSVEAALKALI